ncbi:MAG TPA: hypothetical protein VFE37_02275 [Chloroflexota bacterium]|nr:hypothetical protein [Chloroflexota bacterium]
MARRQTTTAAASPEVRPLAPVRRFDVFAEYKRLEAERRGATPDEARGYGIWVAKVVAGRRFGRAAGPPAAGRPAPEEGGEREHPERPDWGPRELNGEPQTAATFEREIVRRMGKPFYERVFAPAVRQAFEAGERYEQVRDAIRAEWKP